MASLEIPFVMSLCIGLTTSQASEPDCVQAAYPGVIRAIQPGGRAIGLRFRGTGASAWYEDLAGYPVVRQGDTYRYAVVDPSGDLQPTDWIVGRVDPSRAGLERVRPARRRADGHGKSGSGSGVSTLAASTGTVDNLVLLIRFSNHGPSGQDRTLPSVGDVDTILNAVGGDPTLAPTGSMRDYYLEASYDQLEVNSDAYGWFDVPGTEMFYADGSAGLSTFIETLIVDALDAADATVDFSLYDQDLDGNVDAITFLHSGYGAEWGGADTYGTDYLDRIWSHKWTISGWTSDEGVVVTEYNISPGLWDTTGSDPGRIGVMVHEFGHYLGLPDLYDVDYTSAGNGFWGLMAGGSWGFDSSQLYPTHPSAWSRWKLGWLPTELLVPGIHVAPAVETNPTVYRMQSGYPPGECILIENRQPIGFDALVPQAGLAIWHVDDTKGSIAANDVNADEGYPGQAGWPTNGKHHRNALLQADDFWDLELFATPGDGGDIYHEAGVDEIVVGSSPGLDAYQGGFVYSTGNEIKNIQDVASGVSFEYCAPSPVLTTSGLTSWVDVAVAVPVTWTGGTGEVKVYETRQDPVYVQHPGTQSLFVATGVPQGWNADDATWSYELPFSFPFYGTDHGTVFVGSNGFVDLVPGEPEAANQRSHLRLARRIAPLWDDLATTGPGEDIYIDERQDEVEIRWAASTVATGSPCHFSVVLRADGTIAFHYGSGNTDLTPTVGLSRGHSGDVTLLASHDAHGTLTDAVSCEFELTGSRMPPGLQLLPDGTLTGKPTTLGVFEPVLRVLDESNHFDQKPVRIEILPKKLRRATGTPSLVSW